VAKRVAVHSTISRSEGGLALTSGTGCGTLRNHTPCGHSRRCSPRTSWATVLPEASSFNFAASKSSMAPPSSASTTCRSHSQTHSPVGNES
jgi:hypothetical protein